MCFYKDLTLSFKSCLISECMSNSAIRPSVLAFLSRLIDLLAFSLYIQ